MSDRNFRSSDGGPYERIIAERRKDPEAWERAREKRRVKFAEWWASYKAKRKRPRSDNFAEALRNHKEGAARLRELKKRRLR